MSRAMIFPALALLLAACGGSETAEPAAMPEAVEAPAPAVSEAPAEAQQTEVQAPKPAGPQQLEVYTYRVINSFPHGTTDFTQGLFVADGALYETTGRIGQSALIRHDILGEATPARRALPADIFGEGAVAVDDRIISLTWRDGIGLIHDLETFEPEGTFPLEGEGWGLTSDGIRLIVSNGTNRLTFLDPDTYEPTGSLTVSANGKPVPRLNELEYIDGEVWANIWQTDVIVRINPETGIVSGFIDLSGLYADNRDPRDNVLNGIAWDPESERLFVTGKNWPEIHEIEVIPAE